MARLAGKRGVTPSRGEVSFSQLLVGFPANAFVLMTLSNPREKYWGALLSVDQRGAVLRGIVLDAFEDFVRQLRAGESVAPVLSFFPMHRIQSIELESCGGELPSLLDRLRQQAGGRDAERLFTAADASIEAVR